MIASLRKPGRQRAWYRAFLCGMLAAWACDGGALAAVQLAAAAQAAPAPSSSSSSLQVLHWWTSASERKAADLLAERLRDERIDWQDAAIPGGAGIGAGKVL